MSLIGLCTDVKLTQEEEVKEGRIDQVDLCFYNRDPIDQ